VVCGNPLTLPDLPETAKLNEIDPQAWLTAKVANNRATAGRNPARSNGPCGFVPEGEEDGGAESAGRRHGLCLSE
jgi:hypothetical protein